MTYLQIYTQKFLCGHPDEFIKVQLHKDNTIVHNLLPIDVYAGYIGENRQVVTKARCLRCAKKAKDKDDREPSKGREILRRIYMAGLSSTFTIGDDTVYKGGSDHDTADPIANPHLRITEAEHKAHRIAMQAEASQLRGNSSSVPARRVWNAPLQIPHQTEAGDRRDNLVDAHQSRLTGVDISRSSINAQFPIETFESTVNNKTTRETELNQSLPNVPSNVRASSGTKLDRQLTIPNIKIKYARKVEPNALQATNGSTVLLRKSRFKEHLEDENNLNPILNEPKPKAAQYESSVLSRSLLDSFKGRSSTSSTEDMSLPELLTKNSRGLHLPGQHALRPITRESESDSPDWVCETSLAIEAGRMTMDDVAAQFKRQRRL